MSDLPDDRAKVIKMQSLMSNHHTPKYGILTKALLYIIPLAVGLIYWLAFYPGVLTYDSVSQWNQLVILNINNLHPAIHTILEWLLTRIWFTPAVISLFQVLFASLVFGYGLSSIHKVSQLPGYIFVLVGFLLSVNPLVGVMDVTLWKDIIYSVLVLLLSIFMFNVLSSDSEWLDKPSHFILVGFTLAGIWLFRFNGFPIVIASLIVTGLIYKKHFKYLVYAALICGASIIFITGPVYTWFKVDRATRFNYGIGFIHPVVAYVNSQTGLPNLTDHEKWYLNYIYPLNKPWSYSCYDASVFFFEGTNFYAVINDPLTMVKIFARLAIRDPKIAINHYICLSSFVWQPNQPKNVYLEMIIFDNYNLDQTPDWKKYADVVTAKSLLPGVRGSIREIVESSWTKDVHRILWRPALYMYIFIASLVFMAFRTGYKKWLLLAVPLISQSIGIMFTAQLQAVRYEYPIYLIAMIFTIPLLIIGYKKSVIVLHDKAVERS